MRAAGGGAAPLDRPRRPLTPRPPASYEGQRDQLYSQQFNVEQTSFAMASVEDTKLQARTCAALSLRSLRCHRPPRALTAHPPRQVKAMKSAATSLKKSYKAREQYV